MMSWSSGIRVAVAGLLFGGGTLSAQYVVDMPYKNVTVKIVDGAACFKGGNIVGNVGQPALPAYGVSILVPRDAEFSGVKVTLDGVTEKTLTDNSNVEPISGPPGFVVPDGRKIINGKDVEVYGKDAFFPASHLGSVSFSMQSQYKIVNVVIHPYVYNPVTGKLRTLTGGKLNVSLGIGAGKSATDFANLPRNAREEQLLTKLVVNPAELESYGALTNAGNMRFASAPTAAVGATSLTSRYFIIYISSTLRTGSISLLTAYRNSLLARGATAVDIKNATYGTGPTAATAIRNELITLRSGGTNVTDVLFIGDPDPDVGDVPMYRFTGIPTDWWYSDLNSTFPDRNAELRVGRIPIYGNDVTALDKILTKTLNYINATNIEWRRFALLPAVPLAHPVAIESYTTAQELHASLSSDGWGTYRMYDSYDWTSRNHVSDIAKMVLTPGPDEYYCNFARVPDVWNRLNPGLVAWGTHGWEKAAFDILTSGTDGTVGLLNDTYAAAVLSMSCQTANPDDNQNLGAATLYHNAISYIGATYMIQGDDLEPLGLGYIDLLKTNLSMDFIEALDQAKAAATTIRTDAIVGIVFYGCTDVSFNLPELATSGAVLPTPNLVSVIPSATSIQITWTPITGAGITGYGIECGDATATRNSGFAFLADVSGEGANSFSHTGLTAGTKKKYRIYAKNSLGRSGFSRIDSATTLGGVPGYPAMPTGLTITQSVNSITTGWSAVPNATYYSVQRSMNPGGPFVWLANTDQTSCNDINVINEVTYCYRVAAVNSFGTGPVTTAVLSSQGTIAVVPPTITNISFLPGSAVDLKIEWLSNGITPLGFDIRYARKLPGTDNWTNWENATEGGVALRGHVFKNITEELDGNVDYKFIMSSFTYRDGVSSKISSGDSPEYFFTTCNGQCTPPMVPASLQVISAPGLLETMRVSWTSGGAPAPTGYKIFTSDGLGDWYEYDDITTSNTNVSKDYVVGANITRSFCIQAYRVDGNGIRIFSGYSQIATGTTNSKLPTPSLFVLPFLSITQTVIPLSIATTSINTESYTLFRSTTGVNFTRIEPDVTSTYYVDEFLTPGTTYYYKVVGHAPGCIDSDMSGAFPFTTLPPPPNIRFYTLDQTRYNNQQTQVRFYIRNMAGGGALSDFVVKYYLTAENGKTPKLEDYWTPNCDISLELLANNIWCVSLAFSGTLPPGGRIPANDGQLIGLHYTDWSPVWNKSNDFSQPASGSFTLTDKVAVFDSQGTLVYGTLPAGL